jgi:hypothetical protein
VETADVPEGAPAEPDAPEAGVTVDIPGAPIFAPIVAVVVAPITLFPRPVDPTRVVDPVGRTVPVDPARVIVPEVVGKSTPGLAPMVVAPLDNVGESIDDSVVDVGDATKDVGDIVELAGDSAENVGVAVVVAGIDMAVEVEMPAPFPALEELNATSSRQEARASAKKNRTPALRTVFNTNLLCRSKTAGVVVFQLDRSNKGCARKF